MYDNLVSICIPTYNRPNLIGKLLDSILNQTYQDFEVIITDNSDNSLTQSLVQSKYQDARIRYFKNTKNLGMGGNTRRALDLIQGDFFTFTPDDDLWIDLQKLEKQVGFLQANHEINIVYSNASSIDYIGNELADFDSLYKSQRGVIDILNSTELLPGHQTDYFLNILTAVIRPSMLLEIFKQSWNFESEEYFCYYLSASDQKIGFLYDKTVALREAEHYRTAIEDGKVVDLKKRKDIRIRQILAIYTTLLYLYPETKKHLETSQVQHFLAKHLLSSAKVSRSLPLILKTWGAIALHFRKFSLLDVLKLKQKKRKSFG
jgi:glycosyltransferase involved in cell wall biosynthesis